MSTRADKAVATTITRALTLLQDGYRPEPLADRPGIYRWHRPVGVPAAAGESSTYLVDAINESCECEMFLQYSTCKHLVKCRALLALSLYILSPYLPERHMLIAQEFDIEQVLCDLFNADQREAQWVSRLDESSADDLLPPPDDSYAPDASDDDLVTVTPPKIHHPGFAIPRPVPDQGKKTSARIDTTAGFGSKDAFNRARANDFD